MTGRTLPREPWRGGQICGHQISSGGWTAPMAFCGEPKADGLPMCEEHFDDVLAEYGHVIMAPGNAVGAPHMAVRLLWEPSTGDVPVEPSYDEMVRYAGAQRGGE